MAIFFSGCCGSLQGILGCPHDLSLSLFSTWKSGVYYLSMYLLNIFISIDGRRDNVLNAEDFCMLVLQSILLSFLPLSMTSLAFSLLYCHSTPDSITKGSFHRLFVFLYYCCNCFHQRPPFDHCFSFLIKNYFCSISETDKVISDGARSYQDESR